MTEPSQPIPTTVVLTLEVEREATEAMADVLRVSFGKEPVILERPASTEGWLEFYFDDGVEADLARAALANHPRVKGLSLRHFGPTDWEAVWRAHFRPHDVGSALRICPVWEKDRDEATKRQVVIINPGMSFGTGEHFTTRFCLEMIDELCKKSAPDSLLDVGTGSGILAIASARLGVKRVCGIDHDPRIVEQAGNNARLNKLGGRVTFKVHDISRKGLDEAFAVVCANLYSELLMSAAPRLVQCARAHLILSGIQESEADAVASVFAQHGAYEVARDGDGAWAGLLLETGVMDKA